MENRILDFDSEEPTYEKFRKLPMILELFPLLAALIGVLFKNSGLITLSFSAAAFSYTFLSWYYFKALRYKVSDVFFAVLFGIGIAIALLGILFYVQGWEGMNEMVIIGFSTVLFGFGFSLVYFLVKRHIVKNREYEFTMSLKILSRYALLFVFYYAFNLASFLENIF